MNTTISWSHWTWNPCTGCTKCSPECKHCYIPFTLCRRKLAAWDGLVLASKAIRHAPKTWDRQAFRTAQAARVFTCSLSDFFHVEADKWRPYFWGTIRKTPNLVWMVVTKRPERILDHLPPDWGDGYPNVWLGVSTGCKQTLNKMDILREVPCALRMVSTEPLLEDISQDINLDGFGWVVTGGESGPGKEYNYRGPFNVLNGRRIMKLEWAANLRDVTKAAGLPFFFKQITHRHSSRGVDALGRIWHEVPDAPWGLDWAPRPEPKIKQGKVPKASISRKAFV